MNFRLFLLNLLLLAGCIYLARTVKLDFQKFDAEHNSVTIKASPLSEVESKVFLPYQTPTPVDAPTYLHVSAKNLFIESRNLAAPQAVSQVETAPELNPKPVLIGVTKTGDHTQAVIRRPQAPNRRTMVTLQLGDLYEGYKVTGITEKQVELTFTSSGGQSINQFIHFGDPAKRVAAVPPPSAVTPVTPGQIIQVGVTGEANGAPVVAVPPVNAANNAVDPASGMAKAPTSPAAASPAENTRRNIPMRRSEYIDNQGRRVLRTPWGDIVRPPDSSPK